MQEHFNEELEKLNTNLLKMASLVDDQVNRTFEALNSNNIELCKRVKAKDLEIDAYDNLILAQCENILALFQPVASDLRYVMSVIMINNQLERCGDIAVNISQRIKKTFDYINLIKESGILDMLKKAKDMVKQSIDSFLNKDIDLAYNVMMEDNEVDKLNKQIFKMLVEKMKNQPDLIEPCSHLIVLTRHVERLADHATNIAENLVFYVEAKIIAHKKKLGEKRWEDEL
ncbi:phosphate signaling complex protein PhoU [Melioribacteraceae bacterium 4301-Me]|uniref:phosphate signaling complex protein PhoU n=1 Tax=Pyranulibacter aquaticus TaxID=3163344 RepID=UPI0035990477